MTNPLTEAEVEKDFIKGYEDSKSLGGPESQSSVEVRKPEEDSDQPHP